MLNRLTWSLILAVALLAAASVKADTISGGYSIIFTTICQSIEKETFGKTTVVSTIQEGKISQTVGTITFKPSTAGASSGKVSAQFTQSKGTLAILGLPGPPATPAVPDMAISTGTQSGTYSLFPLVGGLPVFSLSITFTGKNGGTDTFTAYPSQSKNGVYDHVVFIGIDGETGQSPSCTNSGTITHQ